MNFPDLKCTFCAKILTNDKIKYYELLLYQHDDDRDKYDGGIPMTHKATCSECTSKLKKDMK